MLNRAISALPGFFKLVFDHVCHETGWSFTVIGGGPSPEEKGAIQTMRYMPSAMTRKSTDLLVVIMRALQQLDTHSNRVTSTFRKM